MGAVNNSYASYLGYKLLYQKTEVLMLLIIRIIACSSGAKTRRNSPNGAQFRNGRNVFNLVFLL